MSSPLSYENFARIRDGVRHLAQHAGDHEDRLQGLVQAADTAVRDAESELVESRGQDRTSAGEWQRACSARVPRTRAHADAASRACVSAREQRVAAGRLLNVLDNREADDQQPRASFRDAVAVLVVDDIEDTRDLLALVLREAGFVVRTAVNGVDALITAYEMQPAIIVMDMTMPVLDGIEATRLIKATESIRAAKVIAYTANPSIPQGLVDRLFVAVVPKPSAPDVVVAAVQNVASL